MKARHRGLVVLNGALLAVLAAVTLSSPSHGQAGPAGGQRARGEYTMVAGRIMGGSTHVAYVVDTANQEMIAVRWNEGQKSLDGIGYRNIAQDAQAQPGR